MAGQQLITEQLVHNGIILHYQGGNVNCAKTQTSAMNFITFSNVLFFQTERKTLITQYHYKRPNIIKYKELLNIDNESKIIKLAKFMKVIMKCFT